MRYGNPWLYSIRDVHLRGCSTDPTSESNMMDLGSVSMCHRNAYACAQPGPDAKGSYKSGLHAAARHRPDKDSFDDLM